MKTSGDDIVVCYSKRFARDFKDACNDNPRFSESFDKLIEAIKIGRTGRYRIFSMPDSCRGFVVIEDKSLNIKGGKNVGGGYRIIRSQYNNHILFVRCFAKNQQQKLKTEEQNAVCRTLQTVKTGDCGLLFSKLDKPLSRSILKNTSIEDTL